MLNRHPWLWAPLVAAAGLETARPAMVASARDEPPPAMSDSYTRAPSTDIITIDWRVLRTLDYRTGKSSDTLRALERRLVRLAGYVVPLEDFQERAKEFLLVPYFGACVHLPPPPPNQLVYVTMQSSTRIFLMGPVWIEGTLQVIDYKSIYGVAGFRMRVDRVVPYEKSDR